ncbi:MAG: ABC transporter substrate-binding protein [Candidatus Brocadiia bacterium]
MRTDRLLELFLPMIVILALVAIPNRAAGEHTGAWVDEVVISEEEDESRAVDRLRAGKLDLYGTGVTDRDIYDRVREADELQFEMSYGNTVELTFNPVGPTFGDGGELNPFSVPEIREAMNWLVDREHIASEIYEGLAVPRYLPIKTVFPDYARLAGTVSRLEVRYQHDPGKAEKVIEEQMRELGANLQDGQWHYEGEPVELTFLIRLDDERREVGDYVANKLEDVGFEVLRDYRTAEEASAIWIGSDPERGKWHLYTGAWVDTVVSRDEGTIFNSFFTPRGRPDMLWQSYEPAEEFDEIADRLGRRDYETLEERRELMSEALELAMRDSVRIWLVDQQAIWPRRADIEVAADLAGGVSGSWLWPLTLRVKDKTGGQIQIGVPGILTEPWNPVAGSNWIFDTMAMRATADFATLPDPFTGLRWPQRVDKAEVEVREGLPVTKTHDWVELDFTPSIEVPGDAWIGWDHQQQRFITVDEEYPDGLEARTRTVIHYDDDLFERKWHDGSGLSLADGLVAFILSFERADEDSPLYDEADAASFESFLRDFRGIRITEEDPLAVEVYSDQIQKDAEMIAAGRAGYLFPSFGTSAAPWHMLAIGMRAEEDEELAFSKGKADQLEVEHTSYISGPSLKILDGYREECAEDHYVPFEDAVEEYVDNDEVRARYENLSEWREEMGHYWVGPGPFYVEEVHTREGVLELQKFEDYTDSSEKWLRFVEPSVPEIDVGAENRRVPIGERIEFEIEIMDEDNPYPADDIESVRYLVFDGEDRLVIQGDAEHVEDNRWRVILEGEATGELEPGSNQLRVAVTSLKVAIPAFETYRFISVP